MTTDTGKNVDTTSGDLERGVKRRVSFQQHVAASPATTDSTPGDYDLEVSEEQPFSEYSSKLAASFQDLRDQLKTQGTKYRQGRTWALVSLILLVGVGVSSAFIIFGISHINHENETQFLNQATGVIQSISQAWTDFEVAGLWIHNSCRASADQADFHIQRGICTREDFNELYEYLVDTGLKVQAITWLPNCTHEERPYYEEESRNYYAEHFPEINYRGFTGIEPDPDSPRGASMQPRSNQSFYFPAHYVLPVSGYNIAALDFDLMSNPIRRAAVEAAIDSHEPALTQRLELLDNAATNGFSVILFHPGIPLLPKHQEDKTITASPPRPTGLSLIVVNINDLMVRSIRSQAASVRMVLYDTTDTPEDPLYLGGADVSIQTDSVGERQTETTFLGVELPFRTIVEQNPALLKTQDLAIGNRQWKAVVVPYQGTFEPNTKFVVVGGVVMLLACCALAAWLFVNMKKTKKLNELQATMDAEKAKLIVDSAHKTAIAERELNDFIAHEVRNPLAAAMSASSFVSTAVNETLPLTTVQSRVAVREDVDVIKSSLQYINDLLRNMLDWHRVGSAQLTVDLVPTELLRCVLEPTATMLYQRGDDFEVIVDCDKDLVVLADRMRLKQIVLNFAMNSRKFVQKGFIQLRADVVDGNVKIYVEDSGPGIPVHKRQNLFAKFQDSLDSLNQGTGIGLSLCKKLSNLMNGDVYLDEHYDSGVEGCPGTRFVIDLNTSPLDLDETETMDDDGEDDNLDEANPQQQAANKDPSCEFQPTKDVETATTPQRELPQDCKVLFVDDDLVLRKLFTRSLKRIAPKWDVHEASNGETALRLCETETFDLIFMDQYMASVEKQLLGTETVRALRSQGVESRVCGLSANDAEDAFLRAGADVFMFKPFPCEKESLTVELLRVYYGGAAEVNE